MRKLFPTFGNFYEGETVPLMRLVASTSGGRLSQGVILTRCVHPSMNATYSGKQQLRDKYLQCCGVRVVTARPMRFLYNRSAVSQSCAWPGRLRREGGWTGRSASRAEQAPVHPIPRCGLVTGGTMCGSPSRPTPAWPMRGCESLSRTSAPPDVWKYSACLLQMYPTVGT